MNRNEVLDRLEEIFPAAVGSAISEGADLIERLLNEQREEFEERLENSRTEGDRERGALLRMEADRDEWRRAALMGGAQVRTADQRPARTCLADVPNDSDGSPRVCVEFRSGYHAEVRVAELTPA